MKLQDDLYSVVSDKRGDDRHDFTIRLNPAHFIYKAHFPDEPITPGVCLMQIAEELLAVSVGHKLCIQCVKNIKFLKIISPDNLNEIHYVLAKIAVEGNSIKTQVTVSAGDEVYAKLSLICRMSA